MISLKCKSCGAEMIVDIKGELKCPYCGAIEFFSDTDFKDYKTFRLNMLNYLRSAADVAADKADDSFLWAYHDTASYIAQSGTTVNIDYLFYYEENSVKTYVAKDSVVMVFDEIEEDLIENILQGVNLLQYPSADTKNLAKYFPSLKSRIELEGNRTLLAFDKPENVYPLFAFGNIRPEHVAWIISRMENFCCLFEYSGIIHDGLSTNSIYINPRTHEAYLLGGWWYTRHKLPGDVRDLKALRRVAKKLVGEYLADSPKEFQNFLESKPAEDAYTDFAKWDEVIEKGFGGHKFVKFTAD